MPRTSMPTTLTQLTTLAESITPEDTTEAPHLEQPHVKLQRLLEEIQKLLTKRDAYQARKQEATRQAHARIRQARATAKLLRKGLTEHYGADNEQLARFNIQPFRGKETSEEAEGLAVRREGDLPRLRQDAARRKGDILPIQRLGVRRESHRPPLARGVEGKHGRRLRLQRDPVRRELDLPSLHRLVVRREGHRPRLTRRSVRRESHLPRLQRDTLGREGHLPS
jgi:hypothetical protein